MIFLWLHVNVYYVNTSVSGGEPVLAAHHFKKTEHCYEYIVKVSLEIDPVASPIKAVKLCDRFFNIES